MACGVLAGWAGNGHFASLKSRPGRTLTQFPFLDCPKMEIYLGRRYTTAHAEPGLTQQAAFCLPYPAVASLDPLNLLDIPTGPQTPSLDRPLDATSVNHLVANPQKKRRLRQASDFRDLGRRVVSLFGADCRRSSPERRFESDRRSG